jgi:acid phosphatase (class A)
VERFYGALGLDVQAPPSLPRLQRLAQQVEDDVRVYVRAAKHRYRRLRPYEIEPRIEPCIRDVQGDQSYPSGHAAYGYAMAYLLADLVPERRMELEARAAEYARQRMLCGVHFRSDLEAGRLAAQRLLEEMKKNPEFRAEATEVAAELRTALRLPPASLN